MLQIQGTEQKLFEVYCLYIENNFYESNAVDEVFKQFSRDLLLF